MNIPFLQAQRPSHLAAHHVLALGAGVHGHLALFHAGLGHHGLTHSGAERRVVVLGVVLERPAVDGLVPGLGEVFDDLILELEAGVVGTQVYAHAAIVSGPPLAGTHARDRRR